MLARTAFLLTGLLTWGAIQHGALAATQTQTAQNGAAATEAVLESGQASWYGPRHAGLRTFSGERFDPARMTAAHASLAMGTMVRVTDMASGRSVIVRVNDREPPHGVRCIDLSEGAAVALGIHGRGLADVTLTAVAPQAAEETVEVADAPDRTATYRPRRLIARRGRLHRRRAFR